LPSVSAGSNLGHEANRGHGEASVASAREGVGELGVDRHSRFMTVVV
jgi:hypothetical protein